MTEYRDPQYPRHGGDIDFATARFGAPTGGWLDLSTGVNPHAYPAGAVDIGALARLPGRAALAHLLAAARGAYGVAPTAEVIAVPGSDIALRLLPIVAPQGRVAIISPTYPAHADAWRNAGRIVTEVASLDAVPPDTRVVIVANPNNPDGRVADPEALAMVATRLSGRGGLLVVDEAFADVTPGLSLAPRLAGLDAVVLRSFGKFFGLPGLRLGFVAGAPPVVTSIVGLLGEWPISPVAIAVGTRALADRPWQAETRAQLAATASRLRSLLFQHRIAVPGGTDLFVLVEQPDAAGLHRRLAEHGIWTRIFPDQLGWLRLGLPGGDEGFARLDRALTPD